MKKNKQKQERINEAIGIVLLLVGVFTFLSIFYFHPSDSSFYTSDPNTDSRNLTGVVGVYLSHYLRLTFGLSAYAIPLLILFWAVCYLLQKVPSKKWIEIFGLAVAMTSVAAMAALLVSPSLRITAGGVLGYFIAANLERYFGLAGGLIISASFLVLALILATDFLLYPWLEKIWKASQKFFRKLSGLLKTLLANALPVSGKSSSLPQKNGEKSFEQIRIRKYGAAQQARKPEETEKQEPMKPVQVTTYQTSLEQVKKKAAESESSSTARKEKPATARKETETSQPADEEIFKENKDYRLPPIDLLNAPDPATAKIEDDFQGNSQILEETLADFGIEAKIVAVEQGPVITRYELLPAPGVKVSSITNLGNDLALALKATSIRFLAPIPGKSAIGVEIPNSTTVVVCLRELIETDEYKSEKLKLPLLLGKDTSGKSLIADLAEMPHLLIAGTTGSGKTVCVNSIIAGLLYARKPSDLKFVMIDPKMVEMAIYKDIPHMLTPVVTDVRKAAGTLMWVVNEMERRYRYLSVCGKRNIVAFNQRENAGGEQLKTTEDEPVPEKLPYIMVVIDELADLMVVAQDKVETAITRLAQLSRAVGIHLLLATQRPSVDVITGVIKANFPARISFKVASKVDSRTVLDMNGADKLLGKGDMLFLEPGQPKPVRGQAALVTDKEIEKVVRFITSQQGPQYLTELAQAQTGSNLIGNHEKDELYDEAVRVVLETRQASVSVLQRRLRLGYGRAARIIDMMEAEGIVGPPQGSKPREILVDRMRQHAEAAMPENDPETETEEL